jgi:hypothetical protein
VVNEVGDPTQPSVLVNAWKTSIGKLIRENVPVTYRFWKGKTHEEKYIVPDSIKQNLWDILMAKFELPNDCNMGLVRSRTLSNLGLSLRNFKSRMRPNLVGRIKCQTGINIHYWSHIGVDSKSTSNQKKQPRWVKKIRWTWRRKFSTTHGLSWLCRERRNMVRAGRKSNPIGCYTCDS